MKPQHHLWILPFACHVAHFWATVPAFFGAVGPAGSAIPANRFTLQWMGVVLVSNALLAYLSWRAPRLVRRSVSLPHKEWWLSTPERSGRLASLVRTFIAVSQAALNVLYAALYQVVYQTNVTAPVWRPPLAVPVTAVAASVCAMVAASAWLLVRLRRRTELR